MPVNILATAFDQGLDSIPYGWTVLKFVSVCAVLYVLKWYFNGAVNGSERNMHSKVVMVTVSFCFIEAQDKCADNQTGRNIWHRR